VFRKEVVAAAVPAAVAAVVVAVVSITSTSKIKNVQAACASGIEASSQ
jgi:hypothetical protein